MKPQFMKNGWNVDEPFKDVEYMCLFYSTGVEENCQKRMRIKGL